MLPGTPFGNQLLMAVELVTTDPHSVFVEMQPLKAEMMVMGCWAYHAGLCLQLSGYSDQVLLFPGYFTEFSNNCSQERSELAMAVQSSSIHMRAPKKGERDCTLSWSCYTALNIEESVYIPN